jgi:hypothetical protein
MPKANERGWYVFVIKHMGCRIRTYQKPIDNKLGRYLVCLDCKIGIFEGFVDGK